MAFQFGFGDDDAEDEDDTKAEHGAPTDASYAVAEHTLQELVGLTLSSFYCTLSTSIALPMGLWCIFEYIFKRTNASIVSCGAFRSHVMLHKPPS